MDPRYVSTSTAAQMLGGCSVRTVYRRIEDGELTKYMVGRRIMLDRAEVEGLIRKHAVGVSPLEVTDDDRAQAIARHIDQALAGAPPISVEQRDRIARLLAEVA